MEKYNKRDLSYDLMRVIACFMVIILHVSGFNWEIINPKTNSWKIINAYDGIMRCCVPILIMISGRFFLEPSKKITYKSLYSKYILRLIIMYIFWSFSYSFLSILGGHFEELYNFKKLFYRLIDYSLKSYYHLWFLPMLVGIYMVVPILRKIVKNSTQRDLLYILSLFFIFGLLKPTILAVNFSNNEWLKLLLDTIPLELFTGYCGYFILGYYLHKYPLNKTFKRFFYFSGIVSCIISVTVSQVLSVNSGSASSPLFGYLNIFSFFAAVSLFTLIISKYSNKKWGVRASHLIISGSKYTLGIYLVHALVLRTFAILGLTSITFHPFISVPVISILVLICSVIIVFIIKRIPYINKFIV